MIFDVLSRDLNVFNRHFLEASAGTGKTFAIEHIVTRLLIEGKSSFSIDQILIVTFTRAATRELKKRILSNLLRTQAELQSIPSIDYLKAIYEQGQHAVKEASEKIEAALINYDSAQISTLHGFCHRLLNEFAFEADVGFEISHPEKQEHLSLLEKMIKDHLKEDLVLPYFSPTQIKLLLGKYRSNPRKLISALVEVASNDKQIAPILNFAELLEIFNNEIRSFSVVEKGRFKSDIDLLRPAFRKMDERQVGKQVDLLGQILESQKCDPDQFDGLLKGESFLSKMGPESLKTRAKIPDSLHYPGLLENLRHTLLPIIEGAKDPSAIFLGLARDLKVKSQLLLEKKEKFSPDDLLRKVEKAAESARFVACIHQKYRAAIIDEFQDTDPIQWNIFQKLFLTQLEAICLVGDPKQSIYAFRNADVYTYLAAAKAMGPAARKYLDTNYRSTAPLVEALNLLFSRVQGNWISLPRHQEMLKVLPVKAGAAALTNPSEIPLQFFIAMDKRGRSQKFPTQEVLKKTIFPFIAAEISALHCQGVEYQEVAILVKDRYMAKEIVDYLQRHGIPASSKRGGPVTDSIAYFALKELLSAVCSPHDISKVKAVLGGPLIAWNIEQISKGIEDVSLLQAKAQMQWLQSILFEKGFGVFFHTLLKTHWGNSSFSLLEEMLRRGQVSLYLDLRKLSELIIEETVLRNLKGGSYLSFLDQLAIDAEREDNRLRIAPHEEKGSVTVMTVHMSKGLEFDTVFALGVAARHKRSEQMVIQKDGQNMMAPFDTEDSACQTSLEEQDAEKMRRLYVALTRAKKRLYVPLIIDEEQRPITAGEASPIELFFARLDQNPASYSELYRCAQLLNLARAEYILDTFSPQIQYRILEEAPDVSYGMTNSAVELIPPPPLDIPHYDEQLFSFSALAKKEHSNHEALKAPLEALCSPHTMPLGSETGHFLHHLFEKLFKRNLHHPLNAIALKGLIEEETAFSSLEEWRPVILPWILELLQKKLIRNFSLSDIPGSQMQQEMEFFFPVSKGMMKGFCDLLFEYAGKYYLLDWKSNYLGPSDEDYTPEKITQVMCNCDYFLQASIYAVALERYVKLFDNRPFSECFGGAIYYFIRGKAAYHFFPRDFEGPQASSSSYLQKSNTLLCGGL
jgi:exodeoxyribonuclease V beta subunit